MSAQQQTLADLVVEGFHRFSRNAPKTNIRKEMDRAVFDFSVKMRHTKRFVLDNDLVRQTLRVAYKTPANKLVERFPSAVLPFDSMWVEYDAKVIVEESREVAELPWLEPADGTRCGMLFTRNSSDPSLWSVCGAGRGGRDADHLDYVPGAVTYHLQNPGDQLRGAWGQLIGLNTEEDRAIVDIAAAILWDYTQESENLPDILRGRVDVTTTPALRPFFKAASTEEIAGACMSSMRAHTGLLRWVIILLSVLNEVPTQVSDEVQPTGRRMVGGVDKPFLSYRRLTIHLPKDKDPVRYLRRTLDHAVAARKRAHDVRGHWRNYHLVEGCEHTWQQADEDPTYRRCTSCGAFSRFIAEHVRGDETLGWVKKEYVLAGAKA